jgi:glycosyltransferase involved in cell wall biosynthesis
MKPEISIIVPVYKTERFLRQCLDSILRQTFRDWELIAVNDCSPDGCGNILSAYGRKDERVKVIDHPANSGVSQARFTGMEHAVGKYLVFVDSDDWIPRDSLRTLHGKIEDDGSDIVIGSMVKFVDRWMLLRSKPHNTSVGQNRFGSIVTPELFDAYYVNYFGVNYFPPYMWGKIYRRSTVDKASLRPVSWPYSEDLAFNLELHPFLSKICFITDTVYYYRWGGGTSKLIPQYMDVVKTQFRSREECIRKYDYHKAASPLRADLVECFYAHFRNLVMLGGMSYDSLRQRIKEELRDEFYSDDLFHGLEPTPKVAAMRSRDIAAIMEIVRAEVKRLAMRHRFIKVVSKIIA